MEKYIVQKGDCLSGIAWMFGFQRWQTVYEAPENEEFRKKRPNPNVIYPGDELTIPDKEERKESCASDKRHRFQLENSKWMFRLELRDEIYKGLESLPYILEIPGGVKVQGKTGKNGLIETEIPAWARTGTLMLPGSEIAVNFGGLDPIRQLTGVQQRLNHLGFNPGPVDGIFGPKTRRAVAAFQATQPGLKPTGTLDDDTLKRLLEVHDNDKRFSGPEENRPPADEAAEEPARGAAGEGGWTGEEMVCRAPDTRGLFSAPENFYFTIYYIDKDGTRAFARAAETWHRKIAGEPGFAEERYLGIEVATEEEFVDAWLQIKTEAEKKGAVVREGHVLTHGSNIGVKETGLEFTASATGQTLTKAEIEALPRLPWHPNGLLVLHSCHAGETRDGWNPTDSFARTQGVRTRGQVGGAVFSQYDDRYKRITTSTTDIYLRAFKHGKNVPDDYPEAWQAAREKLLDIPEPDEDPPMPEYEALP